LLSLFKKYRNRINIFNKIDILYSKCNYLNNCYINIYKLKNIILNVNLDKQKNEIIYKNILKHTKLYTNIKYNINKQINKSNIIDNNKLSLDSNIKLYIHSEIYNINSITNNTISYKQKLLLKKRLFQLYNKINYLYLRLNFIKHSHFFYENYYDIYNNINVLFSEYILNKNNLKKNNLFYLLQIFFLYKLENMHNYNKLFKKILYDVNEKKQIHYYYILNSYLKMYELKKIIPKLNTFKIKGVIDKKYIQYNTFFNNINKKIKHNNLYFLYKFIYSYIYNNNKFNNKYFNNSQIHTYFIKKYNYKKKIMNIITSERNRNIRYTILFNKNILHSRSVGSIGILKNEKKLKKWKKKLSEYLLYWTYKKIKKQYYDYIFINCRGKTKMTKVLLFKLRSYFRKRMKKQKYDFRYKKKGIQIKKNNLVNNINYKKNKNKPRIIKKKKLSIMKKKKLNNINKKKLIKKIKNKFIKKIKNKKKLKIKKINNFKLKKINKLMKKMKTKHIFSKNKKNMVIKMYKYIV
jgi:hypothetical protein